MAETAHARYRRQLAVLATDAAVIESLDRVDQRHTAGSDRRSRVRTYGRFDPDCAPFATLVLEATGSPPQVTRIEVFETRPSMQHGEETVVLAEAVGWLRIAHLPFDRSLTTLPAILDARGPATVVRYHPDRRCTLRFDDGEQVRFAKVYADDQGARVHDEGVALWRAAAQGGLGFRVARPLRWEPTTRSLWHERLPGTPLVAALFGTEGLRIATRMGQALASLAQAHLEPQLLFDGPAQVARSIRYGAELRARLPGVAAAVDTVLDRLHTIHSAAGVRRLRPIHRAPHAQ